MLDRIGTAGRLRAGIRRGDRQYYRLWASTRVGQAPYPVWRNEALARNGRPPDPLRPFAGLRFSIEPEIVFAGGAGTLPDVSVMAGFWLVTDRVRMLLKDIDPDAFAFEPVSVKCPTEVPAPRFWFCDVVRWLDCVDEHQSLLEVEWIGSQRVYRDLIDVYMRADVIADAHAFRLALRPNAQIVDDMFVSAIAAARIRGFEYESLALNDAPSRVRTHRSARRIG